MKFKIWLLFSLVFILALYSCGGNGGVNSGKTSSSRLIFHTGFEGVYVGIHNLKTLNPNIVKQTDASGDVEFDNITNQVAVSISFTPDVVINKDMLFAMVASRISDDNLSFNLSQAFENGKIGVDYIKTLLVNDSDISNQDVDDADANSDGYLNKEELYQLFLNNKDKNRDNKLEMKEIIKAKHYYMFVKIIRPISGGEYDLTPILNDYFREHYVNIKRVVYTVKNVPPSSWISVEGGSGWSIAEFSNYINLHNLQSDGTYSLIFFDEDAKKYTYLLDQTADNVIVNYDTFKTMRELSFKNLPTGSSSPAASFHGRHKGINYALSIYSGSSYYVVENIPFSLDKLWMNVSYSKNGNIVHVNKQISNLPDEIDFKGLNPLDVSISRTGTGFELSGNDLNKINEYDYEWILQPSMYGDNHSYYQCYISIATYGNPGSDFDKPDLSEILPDKVWQYVQEIRQNVDVDNLFIADEVYVYYYPNIGSLSNWLQDKIKDKMEWIDSYYVNKEFIIYFPPI